MNILDIAIAKKLAGGGGGSGTDNYNDLSNLPKINDTTLSGNKSSSALGLQSEINSDSKLASDLVDDTNQDNKFVTSTEKNTWNAKQNAIDADHKLSSDLVDDANKTNKFVTSTEKNTWNAKQNAIDSDHKLSSSLVSFSAAEAAALASGIDSSKVEQISTNQTNILYALNKVGKNLFDFKTWIKSLTGADGGYFTYTDNSITLTATSSNATTYPAIGGFHVSVKPSTEYVLAFTGSDTNGAITLLKNDTYGGYKTYDTTVGDNVITLTTDSTTDRWSIRFDVTDAINQSSTISNVMIIPKEVYDAVGGDYQPYGAPNYDLTQLQAEDRAALAEVIDSGEKNHLENNGTSKTESGVVFTVNNDLSVTLSTDAGGATARAVLSISAGFLKNNWVGEILSGVFANSPAGVSIYGAYSNDGINETDHIEITNAKPTDIIVNYAYVRFYVIVASGTTLTTATTVKPMLCDTVVYAVSPAYVPFKRFYLPAIQNNSVTSGSIDDVKENTFACYSSNVTNLPTNNDFYVETTIYKSYLALQRAYRLDSPRAYIRVKNSNVWSTWSEITNA